VNVRPAAAVALVVLAWPASAVPSGLLVRTSGVAGLTIDGSSAQVDYVLDGVHKTVVASGATNARFPDRTGRQERFRLVYGARLSAGFCRAYDGPVLPWFVTGCKAPDGSYWALQRWHRTAPIYGQKPLDAILPDLRLSHWTGPLPVFTVKQDWAFRIYDHLYGSLSYLGRPMYGFGTNRFGTPLDSFGVLIYVDTYNSAYGGGWRRENSFVTHNPTGIFCYGFYRHTFPGRPRSYPSGNGERYRATVAGPGALPDLRWEADARGKYDRAEDRKANAEQRASYTDKICHAN
jgi:hypothetical protein